MAWLVKGGVFFRDNKYRPIHESRNTFTLDDAEKQKAEATLSVIDKLIKSDSENPNLWSERAIILEELKRFSEQFHAQNKAIKFEGEKEFENNLGKKIILKNMLLENMDFFGTLEWEINPSINILLGKNGYGKTHLISLIISLLQNNRVFASDFINSKSSEEAKATLQVNREEDEKIIEFTKLGFEKKIGKIPVLAISELRFIDKSSDKIKKDETKNESDDDKDEKLDFANLKSVGAYHFLHRKPLQAILGNVLSDLVFTYLDKKSFEHPKFELIQKVLGELTNQQFSFYKIIRIESTNNFRILVNTGNNKQPLSIQKASQGTLSILAIICLIYNYIKSLYPNVRDANITKQGAIVFIDELDAHLHPSWQKKIVGILRDNFKNVQFILTAHSPLVVAGCLEKEITVLRSEKGRIRLELFKENFIGISTNEMYEKLFEIKDKDDTFIHYASQYLLNTYENRINELEKKTELNAKEKVELKELHLKDQRSTKVHEIKKDSKNQEDQIRRLNSEIRSLKNKLSSIPNEK